ncbi:MAG: cob(I)yrinic acid a,c-diamide adenosyltransferase [Acidobacteria bacterium]|nr:cob(I)yrinic acid a,c-diamide adenosyltransferase [Acidobacteriota bacterium]
MKIYTRTGDGGETGLASGGRVAKDDPRVEAYGTVDELNAVLGVLLAEPLPEGTAARLGRVQVTLFHLGSSLADPEGRLETDASRWDTVGLEAWIDDMEKALEPLKAFILPGGTRAAALAHLARTVCRRAERRVLALASSGRGVPDGAVAYLNRLSDLLFVLARRVNRQAGVPDVLWKPGGQRS